jgi:CDP-diacylglycerol--serine O-phosphatidyltransferase
MDEEQKTTPHFVGVPAPAGAMLGLLPVFLTLADMEDLTHWPMLVGLWMAFVALLMISELRTLSPKGLKVPRKLVVVMMFAIVISIGMTFTRPWQLFVAIDLLYLTMVAYSLIKARGRMFG